MRTFRSCGIEAERGYIRLKDKGTKKRLIFPVLLLTMTIYAQAATTQTLNCKYFETIRCVDEANTQGWSGAGDGADIQSALNDVSSNGANIVYVASAECGLR